MDSEYQSYKRDFLNFLDTSEYDYGYENQISKIADGLEYRLVVNINHLREAFPNITKLLLQKPIVLIPPFEDALFDTVQNIRFSTRISNIKNQAIKSMYKVGFEGSFGSHMVVPRDLNSSLLTKLVCVEGIVTKTSLVRPKRYETVQFCEKTKLYTTTAYRDATCFDRDPTTTIIPTKDNKGNPLKMEFGYSKYINHQKILIQDMPERGSAGQMPRTIEVVVENDLVDSCKAGDRVQITGVYRAIAYKASGTTSGKYKTMCIANNVKVIGQIAIRQLLTEKDIANIRKISKRSDLFDLFSRSMAPSLYGHEYVKKALVLLLFGGEEKILENKTHIRGDINMLILGDPSVGKSQFLRCAMQVARLSVSTTARGSTGVGLTAAVVHDRDTGERYLEAGAMVLADRGIVCIDEFDKMGEIDRTAIHEVMEQQTVTIAKAGIHTALNARCSVLAAANPVYSSYDTTKPPQQNIPLPDSILSRFDFLFVVLDKLDPEHDMHISDHVLRMHRYNKKINENEILGYGGMDNDTRMEVDGELNTEVFQKYDKLLHGPKKQMSNGRRSKKQKNLEILSLEFCKKYIEYAKARYHPQLSEEAIYMICDAYGDLRTKEEIQTLPITARSLETIIRLSTAHAKLRLSPIIEKIDCETALEVLSYSLNNEAQVHIQKENGDVSNKPSKRMFNESINYENDDTFIDETIDVLNNTRDVQNEPIVNNLSSSALNLEKELLTNISSEKNIDPTDQLQKERKILIMKYIDKVTRRSTQEISIDGLLKDINGDSSLKDNNSLNKTDLYTILKILEDENKIMIADDFIHRI